MTKQLETTNKGRDEHMTDRKTYRETEHTNCSMVAILVVVFIL